MKTLAATPENPGDGWAGARQEHARHPDSMTRRRSDAENSGKIEQTVHYMGVHLNQPLQVATLASLAGVSPSHFFALFKRRTGHTPIDYFTRLRMTRACFLLETTALSVKEIAAALGYEDPFYFSRVFKSARQIAPSNYRRSAADRGASELVAGASKIEDLFQRHSGWTESPGAKVTYERMFTPDFCQVPQSRVCQAT